MKRKLLSIIALAGMMWHQGVAQKGFTLRVSGGYAWPGFLKTDPITGPKIDPYSPQIDGLIPMANIDEKNKSYELIKGSYGQGGNVTLGFGYMINNYFGVEMGLSFLKSATMKATQIRPLTIQTGFGQPPQFSSVGYFMTAKIETKAFGLSLMPSVVVTGNKPGCKVYPYGRLGISLPVFGELEHDIDIQLEDSASVLLGLVNASPYFLGQNTKVKLKTEGTVSIGVNGAIGIAYKPLPYMMVTAEVNGQYLVTRAKKAKIVQWDTDGTDRIADRGVYRTEFEFVDKLDASSNNAEYNSAYDPTKPKQDIRPTGPFSNLGFNVGVTFLLSKETLAKKDGGTSKKAKKN